MLTKLFDRIRETAEVKIFEIRGNSYTTESLTRIDEPIYLPKEYKTSSLKGLCDVIKYELPQNPHLVVCVNDYDAVTAYTAQNREDRYQRSLVYKAVADVPANSIGRYLDHENMMIELRSKFERDEERQYVLKLLASVTEDNSSKIKDDGVSQKVEVNKGVSLVGVEEVRPIITLCPYRTFLEVKQPSSEFLVRLKEGGQIALFEADGGAWKLEAKHNVADFLKAELKEIIEVGRVIVTI